MMLALVIEDDEGVAALNQRLLEKEQFDVVLASTAAEAHACARESAYDLIILDLILPDGNGLDVLGTIREKSAMTPVLIVSGLGDMETMVQALDAGADDYLLKPYRPVELSARVRALSRRREVSKPRDLRYGNVVLGSLHRDASVEGASLGLTAREFVLLEYFASRVGEVLTRKELLENVWRFDFDPGTNMVDASVSRLRAKLAAAGATCRLDSERGTGYAFRVDL